MGDQETIKKLRKLFKKRRREAVSKNTNPTTLREGTRKKKLLRTRTKRDTGTTRMRLIDGSGTRLIGGEVPTGGNWKRKKAVEKKVRGGRASKGDIRGKKKMTFGVKEKRRMLRKRRIRGGGKKRGGSNVPSAK